MPLKLKDGGSYKDGTGAKHQPPDIAEFAVIMYLHALENELITPNGIR